MDAEQMLDWMQAKCAEGYCLALINDDNGHWAVSDGGIMDVPFSDDAMDVSSTFFIEKDRWHNSIREAIAAYITEQEAAA